MSHQAGHWSITHFKNRCLRVVEEEGGGNDVWKRRKATFRTASLLSWWRPYKYAASNIQQVCVAEFTPGTWHPPPPPLQSPCDWQRWCEKQQVSHMCLFWSISVTGRAGLPFIHRRGEAGRAGQNQTRSNQGWIRSCPICAHNSSLSKSSSRSTSLRSKSSSTGSCSWQRVSNKDC